MNETEYSLQLEMFFRENRIAQKVKRVEFHIFPQLCTLQPRSAAEKAGASEDLSATHPRSIA